MIGRCCHKFSDRRNARSAGLWRQPIICCKTESPLLLQTPSTSKEGLLTLPNCPLLAEFCLSRRMATDPLQPIASSGSRPEQLLTDSTTRHHEPNGEAE